MDLPLVSCIMPTYNRRIFVPNALRYYLRQDYPNKELIIVDDGTDNIQDLIPDIESIRYYRLDQKITLGAKMNLACNYATGSIIANWDDDDWYAERRLSYQVNALQQIGIEVCGLNNLLYYNLNNRMGYQYIYPSNQRVWLLGSSLCFTKELWKKNSFADINVGMDGLFIWATAPEKVKVLEDYTFSVHMIHDSNVSPKNTRSVYWHEHPLENIRNILDSDWKYYFNDGFNNDFTSIDLVMVNQFTAKSETKLLKNVFGCLVHENEDCIIDLVRNLHYFDPDSYILLYNGSIDAELFKQKFPYEKFGAVIHPAPIPQKHGYLHTFALDCMNYALENFSFDTFTIVDSDQLAIRSGYTRYISDFFSAKTNVGMLSSMQERVLPGNNENYVAAQAFKEYDLWKPFLKSFADGENKFVHWTFWPSTVFASSAVYDLVKLFKENIQLQQIMKQTKIWATEEVIFPTLVRLLGYEIVTNPCSYAYVKYRKNYTLQDLNDAVNRIDTFWIHPVERRYDNPLRIRIRNQFNNYVKTPIITTKENKTGCFYLNKLLIKQIKEIEGWLEDSEADLLIELTRKVLTSDKGVHNIVEIGSYHGKSTILFGSLIKEFSDNSKVYSIDKHDGKMGASDQGLKIYAPSFDFFKKNIEKTKLSDIVVAIKDDSFNVPWQKQISILFVDGLHDYPSVARDFWHFEEFIVKDGYVAFHDYADYYSGVRSFVDELSVAGCYKKNQQAESLIVLQKI